MKYQLIIPLVMSFLVGCGGGGSIVETDSNDGKQPTVDVKYTLNGTERPTCHNANRLGNLNPSNNASITCVWYCGRYSGIKGRGGDTVHVFLHFRKSTPTDEGIWELTDESAIEADSANCREI